MRVGTNDRIAPTFQDQILNLGRKMGHRYLLQKIINVTQKSTTSDSASVFFPCVLFCASWMVDRAVRSTTIAHDCLLHELGPVLNCNQY